MGDDRNYLIKKGGYYYRPNRSGYTCAVVAAGLYTREEAEREAAIEPWHMRAEAAPAWLLTHNIAAEVTAEILSYFDSYKIGSVAPIICAIEKALDRVKAEAANGI